MGRIIKFSLLLLLIHHSVVSLYVSYQRDPALVGNDVKLQCQKYDFSLNFNISAENRIIVVYNSALCKTCLHKLFSFKALFHRFVLANYKDMMFIMLTTESNRTSQFSDYQSKADNVKVISLHDIRNDFFIPGNVYIFDKCSRLTYELTKPFTDIYLHVIKAGILSTWYDKLCGNCQFEPDSGSYEDEDAAEDNNNNNNNNNSNDGPLDYFDDYKPNVTFQQPHLSNKFGATTMQDNSIENDEDYEMDFLYNDTNISEIEDTLNYIIPLRIIIPIEHIHESDLEENGTTTTLKYNYMVLKTNDTLSHDHLTMDKIEILNVLPKEEVERIFIKPSIVNSHLPTNYNYYYRKFFTNERTVYEITKRYKIISKSNDDVMQYEEVAPVKNTFSFVSNLDREKLSNISQYYGKTSFSEFLPPWISHYLLNRSSINDYSQRWDK